MARWNSNKPKDFSGLYFRKDLCSWPPQSAAEVLKTVCDFSLQYGNLESRLTEEKNLSVKFGRREYMVIPYIDGGYAGEISIHFMELPRLFKKAA